MCKRTFQNVPIRLKLARDRCQTDKIVTENRTKTETLCKFMFNKGVGGKGPIASKPTRPNIF